MKKKKIIYTLVIIFSSVFILYLILNAVSICIFANIDKKEKCDVAIVLGAATDNNGVSKVYEERIKHGIWLYNNKFVDYILLTGGVGEENDFSDASKAKEFALSEEVPEKVILLEEKSEITQENLKYSKDIMSDYGLSTCIIVSDPLHMKRSMLIAKDYGLKAYPSPTPTTRYRTWKTKIPFLLCEEIFYIGYKFYRIFN